MKLFRLRLLRFTAACLMLLSAFSLPVVAMACDYVSVPMGNTFCGMESSASPQQGCQMPSGTMCKAILASPALLPQSLSVTVPQFFGAHLSGAFLAAFIPGNFNTLRVSSVAHPPDAFVLGWLPGTSTYLHTARLRI